jgi:hypothetical protein
MEEEFMNKSIYKIEIFTLKVIPYVLAIFHFINTICFYSGTKLSIFSSIAGISWIPLLFLYLSSYAFKFCEYHRIPLHYIASSNVLNIIDYHFGIQISDYNFILMHHLLFGIASIICGILKLKICQIKM